MASCEDNSDFHGSLSSAGGECKAELGPAWSVQQTSCYQTGSRQLAIWKIWFIVKYLGKCCLKGSISDFNNLYISMIADDKHAPTLKFISKSIDLKCLETPKWTKRQL